MLLVEILALFRSRDPRWRLSVVGTGPLAAAVEERARELGVGDALELAGYVTAERLVVAVPLGPRLPLHVSLTEGLLQGVSTSCRCRYAVIATNVGGVGAATGEGATTLLVPPATPVPRRTRWSRSTTQR